MVGGCFGPLPSLIALWVVSWVLHVRVDAGMTTNNTRSYVEALLFAAVAVFVAKVTPNGRRWLDYFHLRMTQ